MNKYRVKVVEKHVDYVLVEAESEEEAKNLAPQYASFPFEGLYECEVVSEDEC